MSTVELTLCRRNLFKVDIAQKLSVEWRTEGRSDVATTMETRRQTDRATMVNLGVLTLVTCVTLSAAGKSSIFSQHNSDNTDNYNFNQM